MSTWAYAALTNQRDVATRTSGTRETPGVKTYVDALAALVPAEVLAAHGAILTFTTQTVVGSAGKPTVTVTETGALSLAFWALIVVSAGLYAVGRRIKGTWDGWDWVRMLIPPFAFVGWTMLQKATAFDAVAPGWSQAQRDVIAIIGAIVLGAAASALAYKVEQKTVASGSRAAGAPK